MGRLRRLPQGPLPAPPAPRAKIAPSRRPVARWAALAHLAIVGLLSACRDEPAEVVEAARIALSTQDDDAFLALCEPKTAALLRNGTKVQKESGRVWKLLRDGRPSPALLPKGDIAEVIESGPVAMVEVRLANTTSRVPLRLVRGQWRLDLIESDTLLAAIRPVPR